MPIPSSGITDPWMLDQKRGRAEIRMAVECRQVRRRRSDLEACESRDTGEGLRAQPAFDRDRQHHRSRRHRSAERRNVDGGASRCRGVAATERREWDGRADARHRLNARNDRTVFRPAGLRAPLAAVRLRGGRIGCGDRARGFATCSRLGRIRREQRRKQRQSECERYQTSGDHDPAKVQPGRYDGKRGSARITAQSAGRLRRQLAGSTTSVPVTISIPHVNSYEPGFVGVNSTGVSFPFGSVSFDTPRDGI